MAQAGYTPISLYYSATAAAVPTSGNLVAGELAINTLDGKLYYKNSAGTVALLASASGASGDVVGPASSTDNALARFDLATGKLIQNSIAILSDAGALSGLTGVSSSSITSPSITNSGLTATRLVFSTTGGLETDSANLTFDGTTLSSTGYSTTGLSTLVKTVKIGDSSFNGVAVFAAATPAKLYMGTGTVTDVTSAISATNTTGAIASLAITPIAATNTGVTYTNASTLYIAGAPSAGTNVTITNPYSLYIAAGAAYLGGAVTLNGGTANGVAYLNASKVLTTGTALTFDGTKVEVVSSSGGAAVEVLRLSNNGSGANTQARINFASSGTSYATLTGGYGAAAPQMTFSLPNATPGNFVWQNVSVEQMRLDTVGNLTNSRAISTAYSGTNSATWVNGLVLSNTVSSATGLSNLINFQGVGNTNAVFGVTQNASGYGDFVWAGYNSAFVELGRFTSAGNLGIGTSSPASQLTVGAATANPAATVSFFKGTTSEYRLKLTSSGFNADGAWLGLGFGYSDNYMKAAIIAEAKDANGRANFHFALNDAASSANAGLSDSKMVLTYSGNLGIGTTSPTTRLQVDKSSQAPGGTTPSGALVISNLAAGNGCLEIGSGSSVLGYLQARNITTGTYYDLALQPSGGNVGVGTSSPNYLIDSQTTSTTITTNLKVNASAAANNYAEIAFQLWSGAGSGLNTFGGSGTSRPSVVLRGLSEGSSAAGAFVVATFNGGATNAGLTEKMRVDSAGNLLVSKITSADTTVGFSVVGLAGSQQGCVTSTLAGTTDSNSTFQVYSTGASAYRFYVGMAGTVFATSIVITAISDQRLKENVRDIDTGLDAIMALKPRRFDWKEGKGQDKKNAAGFIAQEFEEVFPECVGTSKAGADGVEYKNINHETLIPTLVKAIQELKAEFDAYKATHP